MRHRVSGRKLKRTASHRRATLAALATALLRHKRITTTVAKAKETRVVVERLITRAKRAAATTEQPAAGVHARRQVGRLVKDRAVIADLFGAIAAKVANRPGGYTRIVRLGQRQGDGAEVAVIELVDYNTGQELEKSEAPAKKKAAAKGKSKAAKGKPAAAGEKKEPKAAEPEAEKIAATP